MRRRWRSSSRCSRRSRPAGGCPRAGGRRAPRRVRGRSARVPALRAVRGRAFRQDGAQRHRVRRDGRVRGGPEPAGARQRRDAQRRGGCGDRAALRPALLPVRAQRRRDRRAVAPRQHHRLAAARSDGGRAGARWTARSGFGGRVADSGEGRWTVQAAIEVGVPAYVLSRGALLALRSRGHAEFANKLLSAMRLGFGGHVDDPRSALTKGDRMERRDCDAWCCSGRPGTCAIARSIPSLYSWCGATFSACR